MKYTFTKFKNGRILNANSCKLIVNKNNLNIGKDAYKLIGSPERIDIYIDEENKAIWLQPSTIGRKVSTPSGYPHISSKMLHNKIPIGVYLNEPEDEEGRLIFKLTS